MKNSRNTRDSSNKGQQDSFMFPERDDDTYFELPPEDDDYYGASDDGSDDGYDSFVDEYDQEVKPQSKRQEQRREKKQVKALSEKQPKGVKNREILVVMYAFICIFLATIGYFIYYNAVESKDVINRPGNVHIAQLQEKTSRGRILAADGSVLAQTITDASGQEIRNYPYANVFAHVVGTSDINKSGLEASCENELLMSNINPLRKAINELQNEKNPGDDVITTLDTTLQQVAYNALGSNQGAVVAIEPSTGKVLAMVSKPDYDPNTLEANFDAIISDSNNKSLLNQATSGLFTPGSIFKICTALEYIRENPSYDGYSYTCQGSIQLSDGNGKTQGLSCYHGTIHGTQNLFQSFANSCNASFANIGTVLDADQFTQLAQSLLFNQSLPTQIPHAKSSFSLSSSDSDWLKGATAIGQGNTTMTPLHAAMITSAIANGGVLMEPYLVDSVQSSDGTTVEKNMPQSYGNLISSSEASLLTDMMIQVTQSGTATALSGLGYTVAGKTGTAEIDNYGNNAWFVGFAPAEDPQIAICVLVENASTSSSYVAVPVAQQIFAAYVK
ncbi:penicillin-binding transpeptidase domain-containing protein [Catenibacillus scindens]|uniref:peptidoglycan D,D-transpeptidase FtsI family protein n=1 Tax=Catenibacillus scindens TaxID=673271 RepID=UPI003209F01B